VSRARHNERVASLISSKQIDVAVMHRDDAANLRAGASPFADYGPVPLHTIVAIGDNRLVCRHDFSGRHAWLIAEALSQHPHSIQVTGEADDPRVPLHPAAQAYFSGRPVPAPEPEVETGHGHGRTH
jgi:hypothetical protein